MKIFAASIMCADQMNVLAEVKKVEDSGCELWHCDVMDGVFVENMALFPEWLAALKQVTKLPLDIHLATVTPEKFIPMFAKVEPAVISFHIEAVQDVEEMIALIHSYGIKAGLAINPETPIEAVYPYLNTVDMLLIMTVNPGFSGQTIQPATIQKIRQVKQHLAGWPNAPLIEVDGNIYDQTIQDMQALADIYVLGTSALFHTNDQTSYKERVDYLKQLTD
ncbi:ribulose-phosphate 3-epimerase [Vagococcus acidifermentans]|uniref:ribulose-phosphate 3-epimerase n=1 Tax=Vagococcus acidifermentans TaxID=564710 RepID=A0A430AQQ3_9ENTE|nr:ribulose-phosphate 3-epimerase [Vagococcus acidifermentans]RSU10448.1 ribulose phosphate epimerase [Vagococcus acidifermentans]